MRTLLHSTLIIILSATLAGTPAMGMPANTASAPVGFVLQAERAHVGADITSGGATIYDGDHLETHEDGTLRARLGGSQVYLGSSTLAEVHGLSNGYSASLLRGTIIASSPEGQTFQLLANGATIRSVGSRATVAQVTWVNPSELILTSNIGAIQVSLEGNIKTIEAGKSYRMEIRSEPSGPEGQGRGGGGPKRSGRKGAIYFWVTAVAVGAGIAIWRALVSPCAL